MKEEGKGSKAPLTSRSSSGATSRSCSSRCSAPSPARAVVWYTGMFYELFFVIQILKVDPQFGNLVIAAALIIGTPFFIVFGALSDKMAASGSSWRACCWPP